MRAFVVPGPLRRGGERILPDARELRGVLRARAHGVVIQPRSAPWFLWTGAWSLTRFSASAMGQPSCRPVFVQLEPFALVLGQSCSATTQPTW